MASDSLLYRGKYRRPTNRAQWWDWYEGIYFVTLNTQNRRHDFGEIEWDVKRHKKIMCHSAIGKFADEEIPKIMEHHPYAYIPSWIVMPDHIHLIIMIDVRGRIKNYSFDDSAGRTARRDYDNDEINHDEINHDEINHDEINHDEINHDEINHDEINHDEINHDEINHDEINHDEINHDEINHDEINHDSAVRTARRDDNNDDEINHDSAVRTARRDESCARRDESCARRDESCARHDESCVRFDNDISKRMSEIAPKHGSLGSVIGQYKRAITMYARMNHLQLQWQSNYYASILKDQHGFDCVRRYIDNNVSKWEIKP